MFIKKAQFIMGMTEKSPALNPTIPQIAFIGRSNVGKSSTINSLANNKNLAKTSNYPGRTQQINVFLINDSIYFIDLPGYGYTKTSQKTRNTLSKLINWYFLESTNEPKLIIFIIDANVGPTANDQEMLNGLTEIDENIIIVANKTDKIKQSEYSKKMIKVSEFAKNNKIIEFSADKKRGVTELLKAIF